MLGLAALRYELHAAGFMQICGAGRASGAAGYAARSEAWPQAAVCCGLCRGMSAPPCPFPAAQMLALGNLPLCNASAAAGQLTAPTHLARTVTGAHLWSGCLLARCHMDTNMIKLNICLLDLLDFHRLACLRGSL